MIWGVKGGGQAFPEIEAQTQQKDEWGGSTGGNYRIISKKLPGKWLGTWVGRKEDQEDAV